MTAQFESFNSIRFEQVLTEAFGFLGFRATHVGGAGQTDIILDAPVSAGSYRVVVDAKSNKGGKIADASIDWNSLADHRKAAGADYAMVVAPGFGGGNLLKRADDYSVALMPAEMVAELIRLHRTTPFSLVDLRLLFEGAGPITQAIEQLRQTAIATRTRWRLIGELIALVEQLPSGVYADAQKLWLLLSFQHRESAPSLDAVEDALMLLSSKAVGVLRPINGSGEYQLTMQAETAVRRIRALARALTDENRAAERTPEPNPRSAGASAAATAPPAPAGPVDFDAVRMAILQRLRSLGFGPPEMLSKRHVRLRKDDRTLGLAFRASKLYPGTKWWWTYSENADLTPLRGCDAVVFIGLMQDLGGGSRARPEIVFLPWREAVVAAAGTQSFERDRRLHVYIQPNSVRWTKWVLPPNAITSIMVDSIIDGE